MYKTRSAITKPTGKNRFDAGKNGNIINAKLWKNCKEKFEKYKINKYLIISNNIL